MVRTCAKTYNEEEIKANGIEIDELQFPDGRGPPKEIINRWLKIVND